MYRDGPHQELIETFERAIVEHPRSRQKLIGPSEIGTECDRCLAHKLLQTEMIRTPDWFPTVGTAVHAWADVALQKYLPRILTERKVSVGIIADRLIDGASDIFDPEAGRIVDLKVIGDNSMKQVKKAVRPHYRVQVHLYGRGWQLAGYDVNEVAILYLPRNKPTLADSYWWSEPYDKTIALNALARAEAMWVLLQSMGPQVIATLHRAEGCYDCPRWPMLPGEEPLQPLPKTGTPFAGILPT